MLLSDQPPADGADDRAVPPVASRARPTFADQLDSQDELWSRNRRRLIRLLVAFSLVAPFLSAHRPGAAGLGFLIPATAGEGRGGKGFRLRVRVPAGQFSVS